MELAAGKVEREEHREVSLGLRKVDPSTSKSPTSKSPRSASKNKSVPKQSAKSPSRKTTNSNQNLQPNSQSMLMPKVSRSNPLSPKKMVKSSTDPFGNLKSSSEFKGLSKSQRTMLEMSRVMSSNPTASRKNKLRKSKESNGNRSLRDSWERLSQPEPVRKSKEHGNMNDNRNCTFKPNIKKWKGGEQKEDDEDDVKKADPVEKLIQFVKRQDAR